MKLWDCEDNGSYEFQCVITLGLLKSSVGLENRKLKTG